MDQTTEKKKVEIKKKSGVSCPLCPGKMITQRAPGFGTAEQLRCTNPQCPSLQPRQGWAN